jgi:hypothetical protein
MISNPEQDFAASSTKRLARSPSWTGSKLR